MEGLAMNPDWVNSKRADAPYYSIPCAQCGELLLAPDWAEHIDVHCIRHVWSCDACGYEFENWVYLRRSAA